MRQRISLVALLVILGGCQDPASVLPRPRLAITLVPADTLGSAPAAIAVLRLRIRHEGGRAIALSGCPAPPALTVERLLGDRWVEDYQRGIVCQAIYARQTVVFERGSELTYDLAVFRPGIYRARIYVGPSYTEPEFTILTPLATVADQAVER